VIEAHQYVDTHFDHFRRQLYDILRIRSVSTDPSYEVEVQTAAEWLAENMRQIGLDKVEILPTGGHPLVYGEWMGAGGHAPIVLIYGHYDVQPASNSDGWYSEPFEPVERDGFIFARGSSDDKGQVIVHLKAAEALLASGGKSPVNLKFLIEGEEEIGSTHLADFIRANHERLKADVCVISDSGMPSTDQPSIIYALRGMVSMHVVVTGPAQDLHSGSYGGAVHNPNLALAQILAQLHTPDGRVAVPGFYDDVLPLPDDERAELRKNSWDESGWRQVTGVPQSWGEPGFTIDERISARPTLEINGMAGGYFDTGFKGVVPSRAWANISCRLVANQDPQRIASLIHDYILKIAPPSVRAEVETIEGNHPAIVDIHTPIMQAAMTAYERGWGKKPLFMREGGSIPVVSDFQNELNLPVILMGFTLNNDGAHGPNERFSLEMFKRGIHTLLYFYEEISKPQ
jgi:acetylornithine deacetylase/succinyl-diaminopimelate desuccinylase-like protein